MWIKIENKKSYKGLLLKDLSPIKYIRKEESNEFIYILYDNKDKKLKIIISQENEDSFTRKGYQLISKNGGSKKELNLLKLTLEELNVNSQYKNIKEDVSEIVIKHLKILGYIKNSINKKYII